MDSNPLPNLLHQIIEWCSESDFPIGIQISWSLTNLQTLLNYFSLVELNPGFSFQICEKLRLSEAWQDRYKPQMYKTTAHLVIRFMRDLGELFKVPKFQRISPTDTTLKKNELVAGFLSFLLHLLLANPRFFTLHAFPDVKNRVVKEIRWLITILSDQPFRDTGHEQVQNMLAEFELYANEAGVVVHSLVFIPVVAATTMDDAIGALYEHIHLLKPKIIKFLDLFPEIDYTPAFNVGMDSVYFIASLMSNLEDWMNLDDNPLIVVEDQIKPLHQWLKLCYSLFKLPQCIENGELMKEPMVQVIAEACDAEYLINSFLVEDLPLWYLTIRLTHHISKIEFNVVRIQEMKQDSNIRATKVVHDFSAKLSLQGKRDSMSDNIVIGFEQQEQYILDQLTYGAKKLQWIFIFGMGGIGKTTFAKRMYHHPMVNNGHFDKIVWCVVSQMHQRKSILMDILNCIRSDLKDKIKILNEGDLELKIYQSLTNRRYLIVMDDLWDSKVWDDLQFLPDDRNGSRIFITGRIKDAAPSGSIILELPLLLSDQCWELLRKKVFQKKPCPPQLHEIGKKIAANCHGLPLAVVVIAGILSAKEEEESIWENVGQNLDCYMLSDTSNSMMQILELSYKHLPHYLKPCFLYLVIFKKGSLIYVKELFKYWIALGYVRKKKKWSAECVAKEYLMELIDRSLVFVDKRGSDGRAKVCSIHDLLHDLCHKIVKEERFLNLIHKRFPNLIHGFSSICNQEHLRLWVDTEYVLFDSEKCVKDYSLRSRAVFCYFWNWELLMPVLGRLPKFPIYWGSSFFLLNMRLLKILVLYIDMQYDLLGIELLVHLRCLDVPNMPTSLYKNVNLEFLEVNGGVCITSKIMKMPKLKSITCRTGIFMGNCDISLQTSKLEYLSCVHIRSLKELEMLKCLPNLRKLKFQCSWSRVESESLMCLDLQFLTQLESLKMSCWNGDGEIKFPSNITKLTLCDGWVSREIMSAVGTLPYLQVLKLELCMLIQEGRWDTRDGEFEQLRFLKLKRCDVVQWKISSNQHFPKLQRLFLKDCGLLKEIPSEIGEIEMLQLIEMRGLCQKSLVDSAVRIREEQHDMGNQCLKVDIRDTKIRDNKVDSKDSDGRHQESDW